MKTLQEAKEFFAKETLYDLIVAVRTTAFRFIVRAKNIATEEVVVFIVDLKTLTLLRIA